MKHTIITISIWAVLVIASLTSFAQEQDTTYYDRFEIECDVDTAYFYRITKNLTSLQHVREYYSKNDQLKAEYARIHETYYYSNHGEYKGYHENGQLAKEVTYDHGRSLDTATEWYDNGQKFIIWNFDEEGKQGLQSSWYKDGKKMVQEGAGKYEEFYANGKIKVQGEVRDGYQVGTWEAFYENGQLLHQIMIKDGMFSGKEEIYNSKGNKTYQYNHAPKDEIESYSFWDKEGNAVYESGDFVNEYGVKAFWQDQWGKLEPQPMNMNEIRRAIGYPDIARDAGIQGQVIVMARVDKDGKVDSVRMLKGVHPILNTPVVKNSWDIKFTPAIINGQLTPFKVRIPFRFKLMGAGPLFPKKKKKKKKRKG